MRRKALIAITFAAVTLPPWYAFGFLLDILNFSVNEDDLAGPWFFLWVGFFVVPAIGFPILRRQLRASANE